MEIRDPEEVQDEFPVKLGLFKKIVYAVIALDLLFIVYFFSRH
jgi:hypothetical protein